MSRIISSADAEQRAEIPPSSSGCPIHGLLGHGVFGFGLVAYVVFLVAFLYAIGFVGGWLVPKGIDDGRVVSLGAAIGINTALLMLFVVQHTIMARPRFKRWVTRYIPQKAERSLFVLAASLSLLLLYWQWRPIPEIVWHIEHPAVRTLVTLVSLAGWGIVLGSSFLISHFELFGLRQAYAALRRSDLAPVEFCVTGMYKLVRHPLMLGFLVAFWAAPTMSVGRLFFCVATTAYILIGIQLEERDLAAEHGEHYRQYKRSVPALIPGLKGRRGDG